MSERDATAASGPDGGAPPPGPALLAALDRMKPVRLRVPVRSFLVVLLAGATVPAATLLSGRVRADLGALPLWWLVLAALAWFGGLGALLITALLPRRGAVLPDTARAVRTTIAVAAALLAFGLLGTVDSPRTIVPASTPSRFGHLFWHCTRFSLIVIAPVVVAAAIALYRRFPLGAGRIGAAIGAAGGALAGLTLHFSCPIGGGLHVGLAHAGGVVIGAVVGAGALWRLLRS